MSKKIIGIDLGTTNSCVFIIENGVQKNIPSEIGGRTIPSVVAYSGKERIVGQTAKAQAVTNPKNTLFGIKRLIGKTYSAFISENSQMHLPYKVTSDSKGLACVELESGEKVTPVQVSAAILGHIKKLALQNLNLPESTTLHAVITVPAYFDDAQRQATKDAAEIAGLVVERIINEPTAAALAYGIDKKNPGKIAVYDLGGGTFDVTILDINEGVFEVLSTNGNTHLGGEDFDNLIINYIKNNCGIDIKNPTSEVISRLKEAAEKAKIELSSALSTQIYIPYLYEGKSVNMQMSRTTLEQLVDPLIQKTIKPCEQALADAKISKSEINHIILVGGMTKMPKVQEVVEKFFGKKASKEVHPDEAVALGASVQGAVLKGEEKGIVLLDVTPLSLGIETLGGVMTKIIERNTTIPCRKSQIFSTAEDNQTAVSIVVYQGERSMARDNKQLGRFDLTGITPAPRGIPQVEVTFDIDANGILNISAVDKKSGIEQKLQISNPNSLSKEEIERMKAEAEKFKEEDERKSKLIEEKNKLENLIYTSEKLISDKKVPENSENLNILNEKITNAKEKLKSENVEDLVSAYNDLNDILLKAGQEAYNNNSQEDNSQKQEG